MGLRLSEYEAVAVVVCLGLFLVIQCTSRAQIRVTPAYLEGYLNGKKAISVMNLGQDDYSVVVRVVKGAHDLNGNPIIGMNNTNISGPYCRPIPARFLLQSGEEREICLAVEGLEGTEGGVYPIVLFEFRPIIEAEARPISTTYSMAVLGLLTSPDNQDMRGRIGEMTICQSNDGKSFEVSVLVENTGNVHFLPKGEVVILGHGMELCRLPVETGIILPTYARQFKVVWFSEHTTPGPYVARAMFTLDHKNGVWLTRDLDFEIGASGLTNLGE